MRLSRRSVVSLLCVLSFTIVFAPSAKAVSQVWSAPREVGPPASNATASASSSLRSVSCQGRGACVAVGSFQADATSVEQPLLASDGIGEAFAADELAVAGEGGALLQVSCPATGACVAVGDQIVSGAPQPLAVSLSPHGAPEGESIALPSGATEGGLLGVSCPEAAACVAVGWYAKRGEERQPAVFLQSGGTWRSEVVSPAGARSGSLDRVFCASPSNCVAMGSYAPLPSSPARAFVADFEGSLWRTALIAAPEGSGELTIESISCQPAGECLAVGNYAHGSEITPTFVSQTARSSWSATPIPLPKGASSGRITEISCPSVGECVAAGEFTFAGVTLPLVAYGPSLSRSEPVPLPQGALEGALESIACPSGGECVAAGEYVEEGLRGLRSGASQPAVAMQESGAWTGLTRLPPPLGATSPGKAGFDAIACAQAQSCAAVGEFSDGGTFTRGLSAESEPLLQQAALALPEAKVSKRYEATLSATGGIGDFGWSVISGALPPGLTLNPITGAIAGTPTAAATYRFTAEVSDVGLPAQTATQALSIAVASNRVRGRRKPTIRIVSSKLFASKGEVRVRIACLHSRCGGTLKISAITKLVIKRLRRIYTGRSGRRSRVRYRVIRQMKHRIHILGRAGYYMGAERTVSVSVFITKQVVKLLKHHDNRLRTTVNATVAHGARTRRKLWLRR